MNAWEIPITINHEVIQREIFIKDIHFHKSWLELNKNFKEHWIFKNRGADRVDSVEPKN